MDRFRLCAALLLVLRLAAQLLLECVNRREARRNAGQCPAQLEGLMDAAAYAKSVQYTVAKGLLSSVEAAYGAATLGLLLFSGVLALLWHWLDGLAPGAAWSGALFVVAAMDLVWLLGLPLDWWSQFRLEERFGFNKSTLGLWAVDQVKCLALGLALGIPLMWAMLEVVARAGTFWWVWGFALLQGVRLVMIVLFPRLVLPLFNKLSPLPEGAMRARLLALAGRTGFAASTIEVIDGSKRSGHSNAFFTGFGRFRRIVLYDTLMAQLAPEEVEAVLAHEIGHYKCGHVLKGLALTAVLQLAAFWVIAWLARVPAFNAAFGLPSRALAPTFLLVVLLGGLVTFWFAPAVNWLLRRNEYEADAFARDAVGSSGPMTGALRKLSRENLSNLTPHPLYSAVYYSHPTLIERERALRRRAGRLPA